MIEASDEYLRLGNCTLSPVEVGQKRGMVPGPLAVALATQAPGKAKEVDHRLSSGIDIRLLGRT